MAKTLRRVLGAAEVSCLRDLDAVAIGDAISSIGRGGSRFMGDAARMKPLSDATKGTYIVRMRSFARWLVKARRVLQNPLDAERADLGLELAHVCCDVAFGLRCEDALLAVGLRDPSVQGVGRDAQVGSGLGDRYALDQDHVDCRLAELRRVPEHAHATQASIGAC